MNQQSQSTYLRHLVLLFFNYPILGLNLFMNNQNLFHHLTKVYGKFKLTHLHYQLFLDHLMIDNFHYYHIHLLIQVNHQNSLSHAKLCTSKNCLTAHFHTLFYLFVKIETFKPSSNQGYSD